MSAEFVFVLVTWNRCSACKHFLTITWDLLKDELEQDGRFSISHLELRSNDKGENTWHCDDKYNASIINYINFYPTFIIVPAEQWYSSSPIVLSHEAMYGVDTTFKPANHVSIDIASLKKWFNEYTSRFKGFDKSKYSRATTILRSKCGDEIL